LKGEEGGSKSGEWSDSRQGTRLCFQTTVYHWNTNSYELNNYHVLRYNYCWGSNEPDAHQL